MPQDGVGRRRATNHGFLSPPPVPDAHVIGPGCPALPLRAVTPLLIIVAIANILESLLCSICLDHRLLLLSIYLAALCLSCGTWDLQSLQSVPHWSTRDVP